jgi:Ni/Fe-hydrogenase subunit HybB-like protein
MRSTAAEWVVYGFVLYVVIGLLFGIVFISRQVSRNDPAAQGAGLGFRLIILPATVALWPILLRRWNLALPEEKTPHRDHNGKRMEGV